MFVFIKDNCFLSSRIKLDPLKWDRQTVTKSRFSTISRLAITHKAEAFRKSELTMEGEGGGRVVGGCSVHLLVR
jgi:hypothetical protein